MAMSDDLSSMTGTFLTEFEAQDADGLVETIQAPDVYGREKESALLLQTYKRVVESCQSQTVLVHGLSGLGKTAVIDKFRDTVCAAGGMFCGAKYFQNSSFQEPHSAIVAAFSDLCDLVIQSDTFTETRRQQIRKDLGWEGGILTKVISNISPFLEGAPDDLAGEIQSDAPMTSFRVACRNFLRAMASGNEPVVVFLDDIQWMDEGSRKLIEMYVSDSELKNVMIILAYRDEEADSVGSIFANVDMEPFVDVSIANLDREGVADMVARILHRPHFDTPQAKAKSVDTEELVDMIHQRTDGNPFHVIQFMDTIQLEGLLTFDTDSDSPSWIFDVQQIKLEVMVATSVADLLLRKIQVLPKGEQETLQVASLLGYEFDESVLFQIVREEMRYTPQGSVASSSRSLSLRKAHAMGLVERIGDICHFPHDKIQSAFRSMISIEEEMRLQQTIGETYLSLETDDSVYRAALHLNQTAHLLQISEDRVRLAGINLEASKYAADRSAFDAAVGFLRKSLSILNSDEGNSWATHFDLVFEITENLARMELIVGNLEECEKLTSEALSRATSLDMKLNSLLNAVECQLAGKDLVRSAVGALVTLGVQLPKKIHKRHVIWKFLAVRRLLRGKTDQDILSLPTMEDEAKITASKILMNLCLHAAQQDEELTYIYSALVAVELTLRFGLSSHSPTYMMIFGIVELHLNNFKEAKRFGRLGKQLLDQMKSKTTECNAYFLWVSLLAHWTQPLADLLDPLAKGVESGFQSGNIMFTPIAMGSVFMISLMLGQNLQDLKGYMQLQYNRLCDFSQDAMLLWVQPCFQAVLNMQSESSEWNEVVTLSGDIMNEEAYFRSAQQVKNRFVAASALSFKAWLAYNFGLIDICVSAYERMENLPPHFFDTYGALSWYFHASLSFYEQYRRTGKGRYFRKARKWHRCIEQIRVRGSPNARYLALLQAEEKSFNKKLESNALLSAYDAAIAAVADGKCGVQFEALANERTGFILIEKKMQTEAKKYFDRALYLYGHVWGAYAKHDWLQERSVHLLSLLESAGNLPPSPQVVGDILVCGEQ